MSDEMIKNLENALQMEKEGKAFFMKAVDEAKSGLARNVFTELARQEEFHMKKILEIYEAMKKDGTMGQWVTTTVDGDKLGKVFEDSLVEKVKGTESDMKALRVGLDIEEKSITYYESLAAASENSREKRFYLTLSREERGHYLWIMDSIEYLSDPVGWYYVKQGSMVDGG